MIYLGNRERNRKGIAQKESKESVLHKTDWLKSCRREPLKQDVRNLKVVTEKIIMKNSTRNTNTNNNNKEKNEKRVIASLDYSEPDSRLFSIFF